MATPFIDFRPTQVMRNKEVYVCYYVLDPTNDKLKRMRVRCNRIRNRREQLKYTALLYVEINKKLYNGWYPPVFLLPTYSIEPSFLSSARIRVTVLLGIVVPSTISFMLHSTCSVMKLSIMACF